VKGAHADDAACVKAELPRSTGVADQPNMTVSRYFSAGDRLCAKRTSNETEKCQ